MWALDDELARAAIEIAFPQRDLHGGSGTLPVSLSRAPRPDRQAPCPELGLPGYRLVQCSMLCGT